MGLDRHARVVDDVDLRCTVLPQNAGADRGDVGPREHPLTPLEDGRDLVERRSWRNRGARGHTASGRPGTCHRLQAIRSDDRMLSFGAGIGELAHVFEELSPAARESASGELVDARWFFLCGYGLFKFTKLQSFACALELIEP